MRRSEDLALTPTALVGAAVAGVLAATGLLSAGTTGAAVSGASATTTGTAAGARTVPVLTVKGSSPVFQTLTFARPSVTSFFGPETSQVRVSGNGRVVGVVLRKLGSGHQPQVSVFNNSCFTRACRPTLSRSGKAAATPSRSLATATTR